MSLPLAILLAGVHVVVLGGETEDDAAFVVALRIQLAGVATVEPGPPVEGETREERVAHAASFLGTGEEIELVVWTSHEGGEGGEEHVLYVVASGDPEPEVETFRLAATGGPEDTRTLALKVSDVIAARRARPSPAPAPPRDDGVTSAPPVPVLPAVTRRRLQLLAEVVASAGVGSGTTELQPGATLGGVVRVPLAPPRALELSVAAGIEDGVDARGDSGTVSTRHALLVAGGRVVARRGRVAFGGGARAGLRLVRAEGDAGMLDAGVERNAAPFTGAAAELRVALARAATLRVATGADVALRRLRYTLSGDRVVDLGRIHGWLEVGVQFRLY